MDKYRIEKEIGAGSYGTVYLATTNSNKGAVKVALKEFKLNHKHGIPPSLLRELYFLTQLSHPNIIPLLDVVKLPKSLYTVTPYQRYSLASLIKSTREAGIASGLLKWYLYQLCLSLEYLHSSNILHRDVKADNVLISEDHQVYLTDFGLSRSFGLAITRFYTNVITLAYRPPEILLNYAQYGTSADMWGVGVLFLEMILGRNPFDASNTLPRLATPAKDSSSSDTSSPSSTTSTPAIGNRRLSFSSSPSASLSVPSPSLPQPSMPSIQPPSSRDGATSGGLPSTHDPQWPFPPTEKFPGEKATGSSPIAGSTHFYYDNLVKYYLPAFIAQGYPLSTHADLTVPEAAAYLGGGDGAGVGASMGLGASYQDFMLPPDDRESDQWSQARDGIIAVPTAEPRDLGATLQQNHPDHIAIDIINLDAASAHGHRQDHDHPQLHSSSSLSSGRGSHQQDDRTGDHGLSSMKFPSRPSREQPPLKATLGPYSSPISLSSSSSSVEAVDIPPHSSLSLDQRQRIHQLNAIFSVLGTPSLYIIAEWVGFEHSLLPYLFQFPRIPWTSLSKRFTTELIDMRYSGIQRSAQQHHPSSFSPQSPQSDVFMARPVEYLLDRLLDYDPTRRIPCLEVIIHPFFQECQQRQYAKEPSAIPSYALHAMEAQMPLAHSTSTDFTPIPGYQPHGSRSAPPQQQQQSMPHYLLTPHPHTRPPFRQGVSAPPGSPQSESFQYSSSWVAASGAKGPRLPTIVDDPDPSHPPHSPP